MATKLVTTTQIDENTVQFAWASMANGDDGVPVGNNWSNYADRSVQVAGTFGAGGNLRISGSQTGAGYTALNDAFGTALNMTAANTKTIAEVPLFTRPEVTAGDGTTALVVTMVARRDAIVR